MKTTIDDEIDKALRRDFNDSENGKAWARRVVTGRREDGPLGHLSQAEIDFMAWQENLRRLCE